MNSSELDAVCGMQCAICKYFGNGCKGCGGERGAPFWTGLIGLNVCPVYGCCTDKKFEHCGCCKDMPCAKFTEIRDPLMTDEQISQNLEDRRQALLNRASQRARP